VTAVGSLRLFVALETPAAVRKALARTLAELREVEADVRWESEERLHATLKFLGDTPDSRVEAVAAALERTSSSTAPLTVAYSGLGFFPSPREPRIVWAGMLESTGGLNDFHARIEASMRALGFSEESRPFHPHVTLGRVRGQRGTAALRARVETCTFDQPPITLHEVALIKSDLRPSGSVYTTLKRISLSGNPRAGE
jgi:RNA 2',3'-cyclic 3'-phosphodiesterase